MAISLTLKENTKSLPLCISFRVLLGLYLIIPLCLLLYGLDQLFWQGWLQDNLPTRPTHFLLFQLLFGTPHILASALLLVSNKAYVDVYKHRLAKMTFIIAVIFGIGSLFIPYRMFYIAVAGLTVYHVLKQQYGVARGCCQLPNVAYYWLLFLSIAAGLLIYLGIFLQASLDAETSYQLKNGASIVTIVLFLSALYCQRFIEKENTLGRYFFWANIFLVISSFYLYDQDYYFFAILVPRLVHDATAYIFYVTHDYNKHRIQPQNTLYRIASRCFVPIWIVLPILSFFMAFVLQAYGDAMIEWITLNLFDVALHQVITLGLLGYLALMHYYTEALTWRANSPYRPYISFTK